MRSKSRTRAGNVNKFRERNRRENSSERRNINEVQQSTGEILECGQVTIGEIKGRQQIIVKLDARPPDVDCRVTLKVKADTGANGNVLPLRVLKQMYPKDIDPCDRLQRASVQLIAANGTPMEHILDI